MRYVKCALVAPLALTAAAVASGCSNLPLHDRPPPARFTTIDERAGTYGGVGIGDTKEEMFRVFGKRKEVDHSEPALPTGAPEDASAPTYIPSTTFYAYPDVSFWFDDRPPGFAEHWEGPGAGKIEGFDITSPGARTLHGIEVGDDLDEAREAYPGLECGTANENSDYVEYPYCTGQIAPERFVWFGGDPVDTITVAAIPLL